MSTEVGRFAGLVGQLLDLETLATRWLIAPSPQLRDFQPRRVVTSVAIDSYLSRA